MAKIKSVFPKILYFLLVIKINSMKLELNNPKFKMNFLNFEEIKNNLFKNHFNIARENNENCFTELNAIKNALENSELWAFQCKFDSK